MIESLRILLDGIVDYAGLFPPAALPMETAVRDYNSYLTDPNRFMLSRFVVPASRLDEFEKHARPLIVRTSTSSFDHNGSSSFDRMWRLSALIGPNVEADYARVMSFNGEFADLGAVIDVVELKASNENEIDHILHTVTPTLERYIEIPVDHDPFPLLSVISDQGGFGKIRTGGVLASAIPSPELVARFIQRCAELKLQFKATAGLHHPIRNEYRLTYDPNPEQGTMFGYLNVFVAAAFAWSGETESLILQILNERNISSFIFDDEGLTYDGKTLSNSRLEEVRGKFASSFGSCSFREPVDDLVAAGLLSI